jgi:branched-chain amino acid transport system substrate-binding protein
MTVRTTRRAALAGGLALPFVGRLAHAADGPIRLGSLSPLTGAGGTYGPSMVKVVHAVADAINAAGGVRGRRIEVIGADAETNPDSAVRAARKLIDVDKVCAVIGTWASAVTTAVAPLCWENKVMLFTVSGADSITKLPHKGFIIRTQPNTVLQGTRAGEYLAAHGSRRVFTLAAQTPFAVDGYKVLGDALKARGAETVGQVIYDQAKTSFRSEVDEALKAKPDTLYLNSYQPDLAVLLRELYRAGYDGRKFTFGYAANAKLIASVPANVSQGLVSFAPSPDIGSPAYAAVKAILGHEPDPYSAQVYDHVSLAALALAGARAAGASDAQTIHDHVRDIGGPDGEKVSSAVDGLKLLAAGRKVNYEGASGPCEFTATGDIKGCKFRFDVIEKGKQKLLEIS